jgi:hypothetical protein
MIILREKKQFFGKKNDILPDYTFKKFKNREMYSPHPTPYTQSKPELFDLLTVGEGQRIDRFLILLTFITLAKLSS